MELGYFILVSSGLLTVRLFQKGQIMVGYCVQTAGHGHFILLSIHAHITDGGQPFYLSG